ncbi:MAG: hypothetical protein VX278_04505, partial [Myxococcota bacterium]|nr:hypothetical protein [Myxococcota bacterium]
DPVGQTPHKMEGLPPDTYTVVLKQKGYPAAIRKFDTRDGKKGVVQAGMGSLGANLVVKTNHAQAEVKLENMIIGSGKNVNFGKLERGMYNLVVSLPSGQSVSSKVQVPTKGDLTVLAKIYGDDSNKRSAIQIQPPLMSQWYFWASVGGAAVLTGVSTATVIQLNQPIPAEEGDVSVTLP